MIRIERTQDYELIRKTMTHPRIYPYIVDDSCCPASEFQPVQDDRIYYLAGFDEHGLLGVLMAVPENGVELRVHHFILPRAWGETALVLARMWINWIWENTGYQRLSGKTPSYNKLALRFAEKLGFEMYGIDRASIQVQGRLWDQVCYGLSRNGGGQLWESKQL